jgi:His/Glu/Gln/Arg/opine family amino acid ABC transporter permease subunit
MAELISWLAILAGGLIVTIKLSAFTTLFTIAWSTLLSLCAISPWRPLRVLAVLYNDLLRSIPLLALLIFFYYGLGRLAAALGLPAFWLAVAALTINESAYLAEVYRGTLLSVPPAQWEAAASLGLGWGSTVRLVILPQVLAAGVPSTLNMLIGVIKNSSLASLIAVNEVTLAATILVSQTFEPMQVYLVLAVLYLALIVPIGLLSRWLERRFGAGAGTMEDVRAPAQPRLAALPGD